MTAALHRHTPTLSAIDPRGLPSRGVRYCRRVLLGEEPEARVERQEFDATGRRVAQWDARLWALREAGQTLPANQVAIHSLSGQLLRTTSVDAGWAVALLSEAGHTLKTWDARGNHSRTEYDDLLRPVAMFEQASDEVEHCVERVTFGGPAEANTNRCGQRLRHDDGAGTQQWPSYSLLGQAQTETRAFLKTLTLPDWPVAEAERDALLEPETYATGWTHDGVGAVLKQTDTRGHVQRQAYTVDGQLKESGLTLANGPDQILLRDLVYNALGQVESQTAGNGVRSVTTYDPASGQVVRLAASRADGTLLQSLTYGYDPAGNVVRVEDGTVTPFYFANRKADGVTTYTYDSLYQMIEATGQEGAGAGNGPGLPGIIPMPGGGDPNVLAPYTERYTYDAGGNLSTLTHQGLQSWARRMVIDPTSNRSLPWPEGQPKPVPGARFDANGNLQNLESQPLLWDVRNRLQQATQLSREDRQADAEHYVYDSNNWRVRKVTLRQARATTHTAEVRYLPGLELRTDTATSEVLEVVTATGVRALRWIAGQPQGIPNDQLRYTLGDRHGSAMLELDNQAQVMSQEGYYPFGGTAWRAARNATEAKYKVIRYSGQERDTTGLLYYGLRYYAPWLQRWINPDPAGDIDGLNLYRMVQNNPGSLRDVDGLGPFDEPKIKAYIQSQQTKNSNISQKDLLKKTLTKFSDVKLKQMVTDLVSRSMGGLGLAKLNIEQRQPSTMPMLASGMSERMGGLSISSGSSSSKPSKAPTRSSDFAYMGAWSMSHTEVRRKSNTEFLTKITKDKIRDKNTGNPDYAPSSRHQAFNEENSDSKLAYDALKSLPTHTERQMYEGLVDVIDRNKTVVGKLYRGVDNYEFGLWRDAYNKGIHHIPGRITAFSSSERIASGFTPTDQKIIELSSGAYGLDIPNMFPNRDENETVISPTSMLRVTKVTPHRIYAQMRR